MAMVYRLYVGIVTALALCKYSLAEWNTTEETANRTVSDCHHYGNRDNCTDTIDTGQWTGHFSKCPEELTNYCIHGECRYIEEQNAPSCSRRCRLGWQRERRREEPRNETEKLSMMDTSGTHTTLTVDSTELPHTNTV
ncbi:probetacellulin isoform X2 [Etheostoma spectabile]|uniref:probetacellulin isoform X2 n=1 Tax=Etheostoma spectabile TaxID=54343 RepID=UPI0013AEB227|nr:probetacellulin-like isoform X2 [Etheostoma spectabile]